MKAHFYRPMKTSHKLSLIVSTSLLLLLPSCSGPNMQALENDYNNGWGPLAVIGVPFALTFDAINFTGMINKDTYSSSSYSSGTDTYLPASTSSYAPITNPAPIATSPVTALDNWNTTISGTWSAPEEIYFDGITRQAQIPITVTYQKPSHNAYSKLTFILEGGDYSNPLIGTAHMGIGAGDPISGTKTVNMWATANRGTYDYDAKITVSGATLMNAFSSHGEEQKLRLIVP